MGEVRGVVYESLGGSSNHVLKGLDVFNCIRRQVMHIKLDCRAVSKYTLTLPRAFYLRALKHLIFAGVDIVNYSMDNVFVNIVETDSGNAVRFLGF